MAIRHLEEARDLRKQGARLGRAGMSQRVIQLVLQYVDEGMSYKKAIELTGRIHAIAIATRADEYWNEKMRAGYAAELHDIAQFTPAAEETTQQPKEAD